MNRVSETSEQASRLLRRLRGLHTSANPFVLASWLATDLQMPLPSLRRAIYELRCAGYSVVHQDHQVGLLHLGYLVRREGR